MLSFFVFVIQFDIFIVLFDIGLVKQQHIELLVLVGVLGAGYAVILQFVDSFALFHQYYLLLEEFYLSVSFS